MLPSWPCSTLHQDQTEPLPTPAQAKRGYVVSSRRAFGCSRLSVRMGIPVVPVGHSQRGHEAGVRGESLGARSTVVGFHVVGVQTAKEFPDRLLGSEHVKGRMLPMLRNDLVFALRF